MTMTNNYTPFIDLILERTGISIDSGSMGKLMDSIAEMMSETGDKNLTGYYNRLCIDESAFLKLLNLLTVNETYFFREPAQIRLFTETLAPEIIAGKKRNHQLRLLSAGCSSGEEPYTLVMSLMERYGKGIADSIAVFGIDIDTEAVKNANKGVFGRHSFRGVSKDIVEKYFDPIDMNRYRIKDYVKNCVTFMNINLKGSDYPLSLSELDVIFYRNVSIYFGPKAQRSIFTHLSGLLKQNGYLILSATETLPHDFHVLTLIERNGLFIFQKKRIEKTAVEKHFVTKESSPLQHEEKKDLKKADSLKYHSNGSDKKEQRNNPKPKSPKTDFDEQYHHALTYAEDKLYEKAINVLDCLILQNPLMIKAYTLKACVLVNQKKTEEAENVCEMALSKDPLCKEGYMICGLIKKMEDNPDEAIKRFKEALYVEPSSWLAHFYLAELYRMKGDKKAAVREYAIVLQVLEKGGYKEHGLAYFPFTFHANDIKRLCRMQIQKLEEVS